MRNQIFNKFYEKGLPEVKQVEKLITSSLGCSKDFAEIYLEDTLSQSFRISENIISDISASTSSGAGCRIMKGKNTGYSYTENISKKNIIKCLNEASQIAGSSKSFDIKGLSKDHNLYKREASLFEPSEDKVNLLKRGEEKAFAISPLVEKVDVVFTESLKTILIVNSMGKIAFDIQPMTRYGISVILEKNGMRERGYQSAGGRVPLKWYEKRTPEQIASEAVKQALVKIDSTPAPAGEMEVILGSGESGILLHESVGHPLEADFNYRGSSAFTGKMGNKVASTQCTIVDQGDIPNQRGSMNIDDEGNSSGRSILLEKGILKTYMYDLFTSNHFKGNPLNGRRESFRHVPMPRMTNTYMLPGHYSKEEIIKSVKKGVYAKSFSGGQVDITSGDFVFSITEGYMIEDGRISFPIKGATLIGNGPEILKRVTMVGNDLQFSDGKWTCGKEGQSVPVGVGLPTVKLSHITVGGTG